MVLKIYNIKIITKQLHTLFTDYVSERSLVFWYQSFNALPMTVKSISSNPKQFKVTLKNYLLSHSYYSLHECFSVQNA